jgi:hypothetical protein
MYSGYRQTNDYTTVRSGIIPQIPEQPTTRIL